MGPTSCASSSATDSARGDFGRRQRVLGWTFPTTRERTSRVMAPTERAATERVSYAPVEGADRLFTPAFLEYLIRLHDEFAPRLRALLAERAAVLERALRQGI